VRGRIVREPWLIAWWGLEPILPPWRRRRWRLECVLRPRRDLTPFGNLLVGLHVLFWFDGRLAGLRLFRVRREPAKQTRGPL
jgi:hypothetical protein